MRSILFIFGVVVFLFTFSDTASACSCMPPPPGDSLKKQVTDARQRAHSVFIGQVIGISESADVYYKEVRMKVETRWKGVKKKEVVVFTGKGGGDCGFSFAVGEKYLVYASRFNDRLSTNICQRTSNVAWAREDIAILKRKRK
jgi:hypothetical protein